MIYEYEILFTYEPEGDEGSFLEALNKFAAEGWRVVSSSKQIQMVEMGPIEYPFILLEREIEK
ncbi:hypothetical protein PM10SUCC1_34670 [Propionigenium maris DSM 9537]|uniref:DUF4177 domain-containing protein n=1 Tax=Propionigenium maris DSM 9537 TaxID=1123000 RepID=A0A9W6GMS5_9FUSO|nr:DUF4177 domain-containing protein [Propionigenium maris]GLI57953.1 hypothetical protein PM10SUCC1_34670 [Propionigenium maris DSM 9537]